jgi:hypothetical protein
MKLHSPTTQASVKNASQFPSAYKTPTCPKIYSTHRELANGKGSGAFRILITSSYDRNQKRETKEVCKRTGDSLVDYHYCIVMTTTIIWSGANTTRIRC